VALTQDIDNMLLICWLSLLLAKLLRLCLHGPEMHF